MIVLSVVILFALIPWFLILIRYLSNDRFREPAPDVIVNPVQSPSYVMTPEPTPTAPPETLTTPEPTPMPPTPTPTAPPETLTTPEPTPEPEPEERVTDILSERTEVANALDAVSRRFNAASVSLVVYDGDKKEYYSYQYGLADIRARRDLNIDTKFRVASLSKLVTAMCAMVLVDRQLLDLDADISQYLSYDVRNPAFSGKPITSRMLMQHTASFYDSDDFLSARYGSSGRSVRQLIERNNSFTRREPGTVYAYSNFGYSVLAAVCEKIYGKSFDILARELIFEPMGIDAAYVASRLEDTDNIAQIYNTGHSIGLSVQTMLNTVDSRELGTDVHLAQGNLTISIIDYTRILTMFGAGGVFEGERILSSQSALEINDATVNAGSFRIGLSTRLSELDFMPDSLAYWHTGSGEGTYAQYLYSADDTNRGIVVVTTGATTNRLGNGMVRFCTELAKAAWTQLGFDE